jgi:hypothetical protein
MKIPSQLVALLFVGVFVLVLSYQSGAQLMLNAQTGGLPSTSATPTPTSGPTPNVEPGVNLQNALNGMAAGATALLDCGVYRLPIDDGNLNPVVPKSGQSVVGCTAPGTCGAVSGTPGFSSPPCALINGSIVLSGWTHITSPTSLWYAAVAPQYALTTVRSSGSCNDGTNACQYDQDLFFTQAGDTNNSHSVLQARTVNWPPQSWQWYFDFADAEGHGSNTIYVGKDPSNSTVELTVSAGAFNLLNSNAHIKNLSIEKFAAAMQQSAVNLNSSNNLADYNWIAHSHGTGISSTSGSGNVIDHNEIAENGQTGVGTSGTNGSSAATFTNNTIERNNEDGVSYGFEAGGSKFDGDSGDTISGNTFSCNNGNGLWTDDGNQTSTISNNTVIHNLINGLVAEISHDDTIQNNMISENSQGNACQCIAAHIPILYSPSGSIAHDVCSGPQTQGSTTFTSCQPKNDLWLHESWNMRVGGALGKGNIISSTCSGIQIANTDNRNNPTGNTISYNTLTLHNRAGLNSLVGGAGDTPTFDFYNGSDAWDHNSYTCDSSGMSNWQWGSGSGACTGNADTAANWTRWTTVCGFDAHGTNSGC